MNWEDELTDERRKEIAKIARADNGKALSASDDVRKRRTKPGIDTDSWRVAMMLGTWSLIGLAIIVGGIALVRAITS